ncbi:unnamed protein product [Orchesella dallaii]|uniref:Uncharacterized protein n=1 Tax=Orchesella dallaii TaxID=48710 RepID=A0ABP1RHR5_9HEXA
MSRRRLSLATINLENETNQEADSTTPVQRFVDNDETNSSYSEDRSSRTERIFHVVIDVGPQGPTLHSTFPKSPGICSKVKVWLQTCTDTSICFNGKYQVSKRLKRKMNQLQRMLNSSCDRSYLETYFLYANLSGVSPFRFGKENQQVVWLKKGPYYVVNLLATFDTVRILKNLILSMIDAHEDRSSEIRLYLLNLKTGANIMLRIGLFLSFKFQSAKYAKVLQTIRGSVYTKHLYIVKVS